MSKAWEKADVLAGWYETLKRNTGPRRDPDSYEHPDMSEDEAQEILDIVGQDEITWDTLCKHATFYMAKKLHRKIYGEGVPDNIQLGHTVYDTWL